MTITNVYLAHQGGVSSRYVPLGTYQNIFVSCLTRLPQLNEYLGVKTRRKGQTREEWTTVTKRLSNAWPFLTRIGLLVLHYNIITVFASCSYWL